jgi:NhaP-type Na+/H+ or K+/H+ antiporter
LRLLSGGESAHHDSKEDVIVIPDDRIIRFSIKEILLFSSVISATDTVAALTFVKEETEPKLFAILFGEGVINDAVCIVLYNIIKNFFASSKEGKFFFLTLRIYFKNSFQYDGLVH